MDKKKYLTVFSNDLKQSQSVKRKLKVDELRENDRDFPSSPKMKSTLFNRIKPILIAVISAIVIGSLLGLFMLNMFKGIDHEPSATGSVITDHADNERTNNNDHQNENIDVTIDEIKAFVLQAGVFKEIANAEQYEKVYEEAGLPSIIWKRENQFYLFVGISGTREKGKALQAHYENLEVDLFVKEWISLDGKIELEQNEERWIKSFLALWNETLESLSKEDNVSFDQWESLLVDGDELDMFQDMSSNLKELLKQDSFESDLTKQQQFLLSSWNYLEQIILNND